MKRVNLAILVSLLALAACSAGYEGKTAGNEAGPISALRTVSSAQELYRTRTGKYGDYFNLSDGASNQYIDPSLAKADPDHPEHEDKSGYNFDISVNSDNTDWCAFAYPGKWGSDTVRNFRVGSDGIIRFNETEGDLTDFPYVLGED